MYIDRITIMFRNNFWWYCIPILCRKVRHCISINSLFVSFSPYTIGKVLGWGHDILCNTVLNYKFYNCYQLRIYRVWFQAPLIQVTLFTQYEDLMVMIYLDPDVLITSLTSNYTAGTKQFFAINKVSDSDAICVISVVARTIIEAEVLKCTDW